MSALLSVQVHIQGLADGSEAAVDMLAPAY